MTIQMKKFVKGAILLSVAGLVAKIISAFYRIPLANLTGDQGVGYYQTVIPIYSLLVSASLIGIPSAISKLVAEKIAKKRYKEAHIIFRYATIIMIVLGTIISLFMILGVNWLIKVGGWGDGTKHVIIGLAISPIFISITGSFKGYFQGLQIMEATAITQVLENITKVFIGIGLTYILISKGYGVSMAVGGAAIGTTFGFFISTIFIVFYYVKFKRKHLCEIQEKLKYSSFDKVAFKSIFRKLMNIAIPITIVSAAFSIMNFIDSFTIYNRLAVIGRDNQYATIMMGQIGKAFSVVNFPLTISFALMISIVPAIAEAVARKDTTELNTKVGIGIRFAVLLALPSALGLYLLAEPIMKFLYPSNYLGYEYLILYSICLLFMILGQALAGILQGLGNYYLPLLSLSIAIVVKLVLNTYLIPTTLEGRGAIIGSIIYYIIIVVLNYIVVKRKVKIRLSRINTIVKPILATSIMGIFVYFGYAWIYSTSQSNVLGVVVSVTIVGLIYCSMLVVTKTLYENDLAFLPKSTKIIQMLKKRNFIN